ncbi:hypothetical protein ACQWTT_001113 [Acinetobacter baumannii]
MLSNSVTKIVLHHSTPLNLLDALNGHFSFGIIVPMPEEIAKLSILEHQRFQADFIGPKDETSNEAFIASIYQKYEISSSREWREVHWNCRFDCFDVVVLSNKLQFKTTGSTPIPLLEKWIKTHKLSCDIANIQDDFEYWSFSTYTDGELVKFENTLDEILLKVLMMVEEKKPTVSLFKKIYRNCFDAPIPKEILNTYRNGEIYAPL